MTGSLRDHGQDSRGEGGVLVIASISSFLTPFMGSSVNIALPAIGRSFGMDAVLIGWVTTAYIIASAVFLLPLGRASDILGRKRIFISGILVFSLTSLFMPLAQGAWMFLALRALQGLGGAMIFSTSMAILTAVTRPSRRGRAIGITVAAVYAGLTIGPFIGGVLTEGFGWQCIFLLAAALGGCAFPMVLFCVEGDHAERASRGFDLAGSLIYSVGLVCLMLGFSLLPARTGVVLLGAGICAMAGFLLWERNHASPVLDLGLLKENRVFAWSNVAAFIHYSATFSTSFLLSLFLQYVKGMGPSEAGLVLVTQPAVMTALSPLTGRLSDRVEPRILASTGMAVTSAGLMALAFMGSNSATGVLVGCLVVLGIGFSLFSSPNTNAVMSSVSKADYGVASSMIATMRITGQAFSMGIVLVLFSLIIGHVRITPDAAGSFMQAFRTGIGFFSALCIPGIAASLARGDVRSPGREDDR